MCEVWRPYRRGRNLIEQVGATVEKVTLVPKYFAELQWGEEFATLEDNPSSAEE